MIRLRLMPKPEEIPSWLRHELVRSLPTVVHSDYLPVLPPDHAGNMMVEFVRTGADSTPPPGYPSVLDVFYSTDCRSVDTWKQSISLFFKHAPAGRQTTVHLYGFRSGITPEGVGPRGKGLFPGKGDYPLEWLLGQYADRMAAIVLELSPFDILKDLLRFQAPSRRRFQRFYDDALLSCAPDGGNEYCPPVAGTPP